jgi:hypothetical protein
MKTVSRIGLRKRKNVLYVDKNYDLYNRIIFSTLQYHFLEVNYLTMFLILTSRFHNLIMKRILASLIMSRIRQDNLRVAILYPGGDQGDALESRRSLLLQKYTLMQIAEFY